MKYEKNIIEIMEITGMTNEGSGVSHLKNNMAVFTPMTAIGDICEIRLTQVRKNFAYGKIEEIITPSSHRISNDCPYFGPCGGCSYRHMDYESELNIKKSQVDNNLKRLGKVEIETDEILPSVKIERYRNKALYPIRIGRDGEVEIGFFAKRSHRLIDIEDCKLQPDFFKKIVNVTKDFIKENKISVYNEVEKTGLLRHLYLRYGESFDETMVGIVINGRELPHLKDYLSRLNGLNINIPSVVLNVNKTHSNVILGEENIFLTSKEYIMDSLLGLDFRLSPLAFYQVNKESAKNIYRTVIDYAALEKGDVVLDLYCGAGTIGLLLAKNAKKVLGVDIIGDAIIDAKKNQRLNNIDNAEFFSADVGNITALVKTLNPSIVVLDPPRKGSDEKTLKMVADLNPKKIIMVSCNSATLARDLKFLDSLDYTPIKAKAADMFPRTTHVESVVLLIKK